MTTQYEYFPLADKLVIKAFLFTEKGRKAIRNNPKVYGVNANLRKKLSMFLHDVCKSTLISVYRDEEFHFCTCVIYKLDL